MNIQNIQQAATLVDVALTVGTVALFVGCPTAAVAYGATRLLTTAAVRYVARRAAIAAAAGSTATAAALYMMDDGGGAGPGPGTTIQVSETELQRQEAVVVLSVDRRGRPRFAVNGEIIDHEELKLRLLIPAVHGSLREIRFVNELPAETGGQWLLHAHAAFTMLSDQVTVQWVGSDRPGGEQ